MAELTKITGLTPANVTSLEALKNNGMLASGTVITKTTVVFPSEPVVACRVFTQDSMSLASARWGRQGHPYASLHAVARKLRAAAAAA